MERLLRPSKLEVLPEEADASKIYDYWLKTFDTFFAAVVAATVEGERNNKDKLGLITSFLSNRTYEIIADTTTYDQARTSLYNAYHKRKNTVFARHLLMSRTQKSEESIAEYVHALKHLARNCDFQAVTAENYRDELSRDSLTSGISSANIRERLLEEDQLTFQDAIKKKPKC